MSAQNPQSPAASPRAEGPGWTVSNTVQGGIVAHVTRDDGVTALTCHMDRATYTRAKLIAALLATAGITAGETARVNAMAAANTAW